MTTQAEWHFNRSWDDLEQVAEFLPDFMDVLAELTSAGRYRYNDSFMGRIPGIAGIAEEGRAIYLLQGLEHAREEAARVASLIQTGYVYVTHLDAVRRFSHIALVPTRRMGEPWAEFHDARLVSSVVTFEPHAVIPKGKRTNGFPVGSRAVLVAP